MSGSPSRPRRRRAFLVLTAATFAVSAGTAAAVLVPDREFGPAVVQSLAVGALGALAFALWFWLKERRPPKDD